VKSLLKAIKDFRSAFDKHVPICHSLSQMPPNNVMNSYTFSSPFLSWQIESFKSSANKAKSNHTLESGWCQEVDFLK